MGIFCKKVATTSEAALGLKLKPFRATRTPLGPDPTPPPNLSTPTLKRNNRKHNAICSQTREEGGVRRAHLRHARQVQQRIHRPLRQRVEQAVHGHQAWYP